MAVAASLAERSGACLMAIRLGTVDDGVPAATARSHAAAVSATAAAIGGRVGARTVPATAARDSGSADADEGIECLGASPDAGEAFVATATGCGAGLAVVATGCIGAPLAGIAGAVLAASDMPVVVVPVGVEHLASDAFHVVVALDGAPHTGNVAERLGDIYAWFQPSLSLLHVLHPGAGRVADLPVLAHDRAAQMLQRAAARLGTWGVDCARIHTVVRSGPAGSVIVDHIRREHATMGALPVVGSVPGHRRPHGVTNEVIARAHVPIILFHAAGDQGGVTASW